MIPTKNTVNFLFIYTYTNYLAFFVIHIYVRTIRPHTAEQALPDGVLYGTASFCVGFASCRDWLCWSLIDVCRF